MQPTRHEFLFFETWWEKPLFYVLVYASLAYMFWQVWQRVRLWRSGRPVEWWHAGRGPGKWIPTTAALKDWAANIGTYVLLQKKVRSSRPKSGAPMHLLIFYGFLSLFLATTLLAIATY